MAPQTMDPTNLYIKGLPSNADEQPVEEWCFHIFVRHKQNNSKNQDEHELEFSFMSHVSGYTFIPFSRHLGLFKVYGF